LGEEPEPQSLRKRVGAWTHPSESHGAGIISGVTSFWHGVALSGRLAWGLFASMLSTGSSVAGFLFDVLAFAVLWDQVRSALFGPSTTLSAATTTGRVAAKAFRVVIGSAGTPPRERAIREALLVTVLAPLALAAGLFVVLPAMIFSIFAKNAVPVMLGAGLATMTRMAFYPPFRWFVNPRAVRIILLSYRALAAIVMSMLAVNGLRRAQQLVAAYKQGGVEAQQLQQQQPQQQLQQQPQAAPAASTSQPIPIGGAPGQVQQQMQQPASLVGQPTTGLQALNVFDWGLAATSMLAHRAEALVDSKLAQQRTSQQAPQQPDQQQQLDVQVAQRPRGGSAIDQQEPQIVQTKQQARGRQQEEGVRQRKGAGQAHDEGGIIIDEAPSDDDRRVGSWTHRHAEPPVAKRARSSGAHTSAKRYVH